MKGGSQPVLRAHTGSRQPRWPPAAIPLGPLPRALQNHAAAPASSRRLEPGQSAACPPGGAAEPSGERRVWARALGLGGHPGTPRLFQLRSRVHESLACRSFPAEPRLRPCSPPPTAGPAVFLPGSLSPSQKTGPGPRGSPLALGNSATTSKAAEVTLSSRLKQTPKLIIS